MPANTAPIYTKEGEPANNGTTGMNQLVTAAANDYTGAGANNSLCFTADSTNGSYVRGLRLKPGGTNVASVARIFINNGSVNTTAANNEFVGEISLPATTAIATAATAELYYPLNIYLPPSFRIYWGLGTAVAAGWVVTPDAGNY